MFGFLHKRQRLDPDRELAHAAMRQADMALEERAAGLRKVLRTLGRSVDSATLELVDALAAGFDANIERMADDLNGGRKR